MVPPTFTDDEHGTVIDGTARSADWRKKQRAAQRPQDPGSPAASTGLQAEDFDPAAAKDFASSLMVPADQLVNETTENAAAPGPPEPLHQQAPDRIWGPAVAARTRARREREHSTERRARPLLRAANDLGPARAQQPAAPRRQRQPRRRHRRGSACRTRYTRAGVLSTSRAHARTSSLTGQTLGDRSERFCRSPACGCWPEHC
jgi:hypothetical protein